MRIELTPAEFIEAATIGLGRAILFVRQTGVVPDEDIVRHVLLHNTAYDAQIEGTRSWYAFQLISATGRRDDYLDQLKDEINRWPPGENWDEYHQLSIAAFFAEAGNAVVRQLIHERAVTNIEAGFDGGIDELVRLDGAAGLEFAIDRWQQAGHSPEDLYDEIAYLLFDDEELQNLPKVQRLLELSGNKFDRKRRSSPSPPMTYEEICQMIETQPEKMKAAISRWSRQASDAEILRAATDMATFASDDYDRILCYLPIFRSCPYPLDPSPLIAWAARHTGESAWTPDHDFVPEKLLPISAFAALRQVEHETVRNFALDWIEQGKPLNFVIELLEHNYRAGDWPMIVAAVQRDMSLEALHGAGMGVRRVFEEHPDPEAAPALLHLVEHGPCSFCRFGFLEALFKLDALPELMRAEAHFDSDSDIREWAAANFNL